MKLPFPAPTGENLTNDFLRFIYRRFVDFPTYKQVRISTNYTVDKEDYYIGVTDTTAPRTITLPAIASMPVSMRLVVVDESGGAATHNIIVDGDGSETINGAATQIINSNYGVLRILRGPTAWFLW